MHIPHTCPLLYLRFFIPTLQKYHRVSASPFRPFLQNSDYYSTTPRWLQPNLRTHPIHKSVLEKFINQNQETIKIAKKNKQSCTIFNLNIIYVKIQVNRHTAPYLVHFLPCLAPQLVRSKMPIQKPPVLAQIHISSSKINIYLTNSIRIRKICTTNITHASMSAHIGVQTILDVLSAISHPDLIIFCIKQFKIEPKFAQLQAIKNM